ncbi:MAG: hypothetical protein AAFO83_00190 [Cyanobacteria bacterium J06607_13]
MTLASTVFAANQSTVRRDEAGDRELGKLIVSALEDGYTSGVEALMSYAVKGNTIYGRFRDEGKAFGYTLSDSEISYWQVRGQERTDSLLDEPVYRVDRMKGAKGKKCNIGTKCRYGCIASSKTCRLEPSPAAKGIIRKAIALVKQLLGQGKSNPQDQKKAIEAGLQQERSKAQSARKTQEWRLSRNEKAYNRNRAAEDREAQEQGQRSNIAQLRRMKRNDSDSSWLSGYLDVMENRFDQRGQGVPCGSGWISRAKKCSKEKASQTPKEAKSRGAKKARERLKLKRKIESNTNMGRTKAYYKEPSAGSTKQTSPKLVSPTQEVARLNRQGIKVKAAPHMLTRQEYINAFPGTKKKIADTFGIDPSEDIQKWPDEGYSIEIPNRRKGQPKATGKNLKEAAYKFAVATGKAPDHFQAVQRAISAGNARESIRTLELDYPSVLSSLNTKLSAARKGVPDRSQEIANAPLQNRKKPTYIEAISIDSADFQQGYDAVMQSEVA